MMDFTNKSANDLNGFGEQEVMMISERSTIQVDNVPHYKGGGQSKHVNNSVLNAISPTIDIDKVNEKSCNIQQPNNDASGLIIVNGDAGEALDNTKLDFKTAINDKEIKHMVGEKHSTRIGASCCASITCTPCISRK